MKKIVLTILTIAFSLFPGYAIKKIEANPINIGVSIVEYTDSASIVSDLKYYGYTLLSKLIKTEQFLVMLMARSYGS